MIGEALLAGGHFRMRVAVGGHVTVRAYGEGQRPGVRIAAVVARLRLGHTTTVHLAPAPFGIASVLIRGCHATASAACAIAGSPTGIWVQVWRGSHRLVMFQPSSTSFTIPLPSGHYRLILLNAQEHPISGITGSRIAVRTHRVSRTVLRIPAR